MEIAEQFKGLIPRLLGTRTQRHGRSPADLDLETLRRTLGVVDPLFGPRRYFRLKVEGLETLPPPPVLLVSNHSGGTTVLDAWGLGVAWYRHFGLARPLRAMGHELIFATRATGRYFSSLGVLNGDPRTGLAALSSGSDLLVMPGGDLDAWRPWRDRYRVGFSGRVGYARLALRAGVPVVPVAHAGAHDTLLVLTDGRRLAERLHFPLLARGGIFPVHLSLPWGLAFGPWPHLPLPVTLRYKFGEALRPAHSTSPPSDAEVRAFDARLRLELQRLLDGMA